MSRARRSWHTFCVWMRVLHPSLASWSAHLPLPSLSHSVVPLFTMLVLSMVGAGVVLACTRPGKEAVRQSLVLQQSVMHFP